MERSLFLVRHAIAEPRGKEWPDDTQRPLTSDGAERMREIVAGLRELDVTIDLVLTSPLVRAAQTADILIAGLKPKPELRSLPALAPGTSPAALADRLVAEGDVRAIALVGHEPGMGEFAAWLTGAGTPLPFKKGGICRIDVSGLPPKRDGRLIWFATPKMLRAMG